MARGMAPALLIVAFLVVSGAAGSFYYLTSSPTRTAFLNVESPTVQVDQGEGFEQATDGMDLGLEDKVKTTSGVASIVLYESIIVALEPNSVVAIKDLSKDHVKVSHDEGSAWHKFTGLTGISAFSVETPNTVATVRGTEFGTEMDQVIVTEGEVEVVTKDGTKYLLKAGEKLYEDEGGEWIKGPMTPEDTRTVLEKMKDTVDRLKNLRMDEIQKKKFLYGTVKSMYSLTDKDVEQYADLADVGEFDLDDVEDKIPFKTEVIRKVRAITEEIIETNTAIAILENEPTE